MSQILEFQKKNTENKHKVGNLGKIGTVLYPSCTIQHAQSMFVGNEHLSYISVVDRDCRFYGLIDRKKVLTYNGNAHESVESIMESDIIQIDADKSLKNAVGKLMIREEDRFYVPFVILKKHRYYGMATIRELLIAIGKEI